MKNLIFVALLSFMAFTTGCTLESFIFNGEEIAPLIQDKLEGG